MQNFNRALPFSAIQSCLNQYKNVYIETDCEKVALGKTEQVTFESEKLIAWLQSNDSKNVNIEFGVYTEEFVSIVENLFPNEPDLVNSIQIDRLTVFIVVYDLNNKPIEAFNFGDIHP